MNWSRTCSAPAGMKCPLKYKQGVIRIKCAGRKKKCIVTTQGTYFSQQSIHCQKVLANLSLVMVQTTPSRLDLQLSWDSKRSPSFNFSPKKKKSLCVNSANKAGRRSFLSSCHYFKAQNEAAGHNLGVVPTRKPVLEQQSRTFWLENCLGLSLGRSGVCIDGFTAGFSKQRQQQQPQLQWFFLSFWLTHFLWHILLWTFLLFILKSK